MGSPGQLRRWPISPSQRAAMRAAQEHVDRVLRQGTTAQEQARARAEIEAARQPRQPQLPLKVRP